VKAGIQFVQAVKKDPKAVVVAAVQSQVPEPTKRMVASVRSVQKGDHKAAARHMARAQVAHEKNAEEALATLATAGAGAGVSAARAGSIRGVNPRGTLGSAGRTQNCVNCSVATDATLAGSPATALPSSGAVSIRVLERHFGARFGPTTTIDAITAQVQAAGPGARGIVFGSRGSGPGHVFNVVNQRGTVRFLDGQSGTAANVGDGFNGFRLLPTN
jgi:hypothetical protein